LLSLMFHGRVELARVGGYIRASAKPLELGIYDRGGVSYLSCARGSCISCFGEGGGIHHRMHGVLRAGIWCADTSTSLLPAAVLKLGTASLDSIGDLAYDSIRDPVRDLLFPSPAAIGLGGGSSGPG
jgi:hypothetical protein